VAPIIEAAGSRQQPFMPLGGYLPLKRPALHQPSFCTALFTQHFLYDAFCTVL